MIAKAIEKQKILSSHEHIGSLVSFGQVSGQLFPSDVVPSLKPAKTGVLELVFSPYLASLIADSGFDYPCDEEMGVEKMGDMLIDLFKAFNKFQGTGVCEALKEAFKDLYDADVDEIQDKKDKLIELDDKVRNNYSDYFGWFAFVMGKSGTEGFLKPVHPEYFTAMQGTNGKETEYAIPILRVDSLIGFPGRKKELDFEGVCRPSGTEIKDIGSLEDAIAWTFDLVEKSGCKAIKQLQAYYRTIAIKDREISGVDNALKKIAQGEKDSNNISGEDVHTVQDYIMKRILEEADKRQMPYQIHTGMTTLKNSNPADLEGIFKEYKNIKFVLLHTYPFVEQACYLARTNSNVYLDTSWQVLQSPGVLKKCLGEWIGMVPSGKITSSIDATCLEEYHGGQVMTRRILGKVLEEKIQGGEINEKFALETVEKIMEKNAKEIYFGEGV